jgi:hypothetical protein
MDAVVEDALRAVAAAETALREAEAALREAWALRLAAFREAGWVVAYCHDTRPIPPTQRLVIEDADGTHVDVDQLAAEAEAR